MKRWMFIISLGGCVGLSFIMTFLVILSWWGGQEGQVFLTFNLYNERIIETFIFPLWSVLGLWSTIELIDHYYNKTGK